MKKTMRAIASILAFALPVTAFTACSDSDTNGPEYSHEAEILYVAFTNQPVVKVQPTRSTGSSSTDYTFYVQYDAQDEDLDALVPSIVVSEGATVSPRSGEPADFTGGSVTYTVTAEDGRTTKKYELICVKLPNELAMVLSVEIEDQDGIISEQPVMTPGDESATFKVVAGTTADQKKFAPVFEYIGASISPDSGEEVDFSSGSVEYTLIADAGQEYTFTLYCEAELFTNAQIEQIGFDSPLLSKEVQIDGSNITVIVTGVATDAEIAALAPTTLVLSPGATVNYPAGTAPGFVDGVPVEYIVTAEDGETTNSYYVTCQRNIVYYDFEDWYDKDEYTMVRPFWNANAGVATAITLGIGVPFPTAATTDTPSGEGFAAELKTYKGKKVSLVPTTVVAGSMFLGGFNLPISQVGTPLVGTKFGIPFYEKPLKVTGMFKYIPGNPADFWHNEDAAPGTLDSYAMTAILYEVDDYGTWEDGEYKTGSGIFGSYLCGDILTGVDLNGDIHNNERVRDIVQKFGTETVNTFTEFELELDYRGYEYSPEKKYKFALIFSSSKDGATYSGADGSTLIIDDVYVYCE